MYICLCICFATKQVVLSIEAALVSTPYCLPPLLATANRISRTGEASHGICVYGRKSRVYFSYTQQDHPMGNTEIILQYYNSNSCIGDKWSGWSMSCCNSCSLPVSLMHIDLLLGQQVESKTVLVLLNIKADRSLLHSTSQFMPMTAQ